MTFAVGAPRPAKAGRKKGTPNKLSVALRRITAAEDEEIVAKVLANAKTGDAVALGIYFRHLRAGRTLAIDGYVAPTNADEARAMLLKLTGRLANGEIPIEAHQAITGALRIYLEDRTSEQQKTLDRLVAAMQRPDDFLQIEAPIVEAQAQEAQPPNGEASSGSP